MSILQSPPNTSPSFPRPGAATPVRKISAHEFEKGGLLKPIVTTIDGTPTFISPAGGAENVAILAKVRAGRGWRGLMGLVRLRTWG